MFLSCQLPAWCLRLPSRSRSWLTAGLGLVVLAAGGRMSAQNAPLAPAVITTVNEYWSMSEAEKRRPQPVRMELVVYYYDATWSLLYGQTGNTASYLPVRGRALPIKSGQTVRLEGSVVPVDGFNGELIRVTVLAEHTLPAPLPTVGRVDQVAVLNSRWVQIEGYVFEQKEPDAGHIEARMLSENHLVNLNLQIGGTEPIPQLVGAHIRVQGVYDAVPDSTGKVHQIALWTAEPGRLEVIGWLADDARFKLPRTPIDQLDASTNEPWVRVVGEVRSQEAGTSLTVHDDTGQIVIPTAQPEVLPANATVEVIGRVARGEPGWTLGEPLFRRKSAGGDVSSGLVRGPGQAPQRLRLAEQVLHMPGEEAEKRYPVTLRGVVTWFDEHVPYFYLQDASGGVCVRYDPRQRTALAPGAALTITGVTVRGSFATEVKLIEATVQGTTALPPARGITLDQALSGAEECFRVEMRGYVRQVSDDAGWKRLDLTGATGEFSAYLHGGDELGYLRGAVVRVRGVCSTVTDSKHEISGIRLWLQNREAVLVDEPATRDPFAVPAQSISGLRQATVPQAASQRARVTGMVLLHQPGRFLYLQDGPDGLFVLSREKNPLQPGEWVEVVGLPGRVGNRFALREAVWRKAQPGPPIVPREIKEAKRLDPAADAQLVRLIATLRQVVTEETQMHLMLEADGVTFEGTVPARAGWPPLEAGSQLALTGVYVLEFDEYRQPRGFHLELRGPADVSVLATPPWWTAARAVAVVGGLSVCVVLGIVWVAVLRRRVRKQTEQLRRHMEQEARMRAELERTSRLDSLGVLAGGIAHDFNNLLTTIKGNLGLIRVEDEAMRLVGQLVTNAERATKRAAEITQQLLTFAKGGDPLRTAVDLPQVVREAAEFVRHGSNVRIEFAIEPGLPPGNVDASQISRVVHNLVLNAVQAMPEGGVVRVGLCARFLESGVIPSLAAGRYLELTITDNGTGISSDQLPRVFDPYFSTKPMASGLGLATAYSIVKKHQGHISVESAAGGGATFHVWVSAANTLPAAKSNAPAADPVPRASSAKVLFMDDEADVCELARAILRRGGHSSTVVHDGAAAVKAFDEAKAAGEPYDVVILDLTVPGGMGGRETVARLRKIDPAVRAIASSGYSQDPVMADHQMYGFTAVLPKPYDHDSFTEVIDRVRQKARL